MQLAASFNYNLDNLCFDAADLNHMEISSANFALLSNTSVSSSLKFTSFGCNQ